MLNPEELAIMTKAFEEHCLVHNVVDEKGRDDDKRFSLCCFSKATQGQSRSYEQGDQGYAAFDPALSSPVSQVRPRPR